MSKREHKTSPFKVFGILCLIILILTSAWVIAVRLVFKNQNVTPSIDNKSLYVVRTADMEPLIKQDTLLIIQNKTPVLDDKGKTIVVDNVATYGTTAMVLKDVITDNNTAMYEVGFVSSDKVFLVNSDQIVGVATKMDHFLGWIIVQSGTVHGMLLLVLTPLLLMIVFLASHSWWKQKNNAKKYMGHREKVRELEKQVEAIEAEKFEVAQQLKEKEELLEAEATKENAAENPEPLTPVEKIVEIKEEIKQSASNTAIEELLKLCEEENQKLKAKFDMPPEDQEILEEEIGGEPSEDSAEDAADESLGETVKKIAEQDPE